MYSNTMDFEYFKQTVLASSLKDEDADYVLGLWCDNVE